MTFGYPRCVAEFQGTDFQVDASFVEFVADIVSVFGRADFARVEN